MLYMPLIRSLSKRFYCSALSAQDLCQAGYLGLIHAIRCYNPEMQAEFSTYAVPWILGEMKKALRNAVDSTGAVRRSRKIMRDVHTLSVELGREPRMREIAEYCNVSAAEIMHILESASLPVSLDGSSEADERSLMDARRAAAALPIQRTGIACTFQACRKSTGSDSSLLSGLYTEGNCGNSEMQSGASQPNRAAGTRLSQTGA